MKALELKIPPPLVALLIGVGMWLLARATLSLQLPAALRLGAALVLAAAGIGAAVSGVVAIHRAKTTLNPFNPDETTSLVTNGIFERTRNPMYLGLLLVVTAWAVYLCVPWALLGPLVFVFYLNRFQIAPEERIMAAKFGNEFSAYRQKVRRWL